MLGRRFAPRVTVPLPVAAGDPATHDAASGGPAAMPESSSVRVNTESSPVLAGPSESVSRTPLDVMRQVFGDVFAQASRYAWLLCAAAIFGLTYGLDTADLDLIRRCLNRSTAPTVAAREAWIIVGRRGGKSHFAAFLLVFLACFKTYTLAPGERGVAVMIAADRRQARVCKGYVYGFLRSVAMLAAMIANETRDSIELTNGITIEIHTASFRTLRGYTVVAAVCDEVAFWPTGDSANPDSEILTALRPAMATVPGAMLIVISSPYAKRGELYRMHRDHFGKNDDPILVWHADTRTMNPTVPSALIEQAYSDDPTAAAAEYGAQFRSDVETFMSHEAIEAVVIEGRREVLPMPGRTYLAHFDAAGGSGADSQTLAIAHAEDQNGQRVGILDAVREARPPFSPEAIVKDFAELLHAYKITELQSDRWGGTYPIEAFAKHGITCKPSARTSSEQFRDFLPLLNSERIELLDHPRLLAQLAALERRTSRGGKDAISHPPAGHDDLAVVCAGVLTRASAEREPMRFYFPGEASRSLSSDQLRAMHDERAETARAESAEHIRNQIARSGAYFPSDPF
jgi:hypothetical protein